MEWSDSDIYADAQRELKRLLQDETSASKLEHLAAALIGRLLQVEIAVAKSGFQHGGDSGPAGRQGRRFRIEAKKYSDTTSLSDRELLGEMDHALARDDALEAWVLVATRTVSEQLAQALTQKGEEIGVPVIIHCWKDQGLSTLAALCASSPSIVGEIFSPEASNAAQVLSCVAGDAIQEIIQDLLSWNLGFETVRRRSHSKLNEIWTSPRVSKAELGQDAAGGAQPKKVRRSKTHRALDDWWRGKALEDAPVAVVGLDGVGKTWATLDWLIEHQSEQPIVLVIPSSAVPGLQAASETMVKAFLADRLYELAGNRDRAHWLRRLDLMLRRPGDEGPVITIFLDGLNQEPAVPWSTILKIFQANAFVGRIRVILSTRPHHFVERLASLRCLVVPVVTATVDAYNIEPDGELDQMLAFEGLTRSDLQADLIDLARTPRVFKLVVTLRERLGDAEKVTIHRLLWEYGRDTFGERADRSFSEGDWRAWLHDIASNLREGTKEFTVRALGETTNRPDLTHREVYARLSDIIDGRFTKQGLSGKHEFSPTVVAHSLGAALLSHLNQTPATHDTLETVLVGWLDPIAGLDERSEILRAAVSILIELSDPVAAPLGGVLVTAWLQSQNMNEQHKRELAGLASSLTMPLLDALEHSRSRAHASARLLAVNALRHTPDSDENALKIIVERVTEWFLVISRDVRLYLHDQGQAEKYRSERLIKSVGVDRSGPLTVLARTLKFVDFDDGALGTIVASILEPFPLASAAQLFEAAAINASVAARCSGWDGIKWLCLLNEKDPVETAVVLRNIARSVQERGSEAGINPFLSGRVADHLLRLSGFEEDELAANQIPRAPDHSRSYATEYLSSPGKSYFALERRHAELVLLDRSLSIFHRLSRTASFWPDPLFIPPAEIVSEVRTAAATFDPTKFYESGRYSPLDHDFEEFEMVLARCDPNLLAQIRRREIGALADATPEERYSWATRAIEKSILAEPSSKASAKALRLKGQEIDPGNELFAASHILLLELQNECALTQAIRLIEADLDTIITDLQYILSPLDHDQSVDLVVRYGDGSVRQQRSLLSILSFQQTTFPDSVWEWLERHSRMDDEINRGIAFRTLSRSDPQRFGSSLLIRDWAWDGKEHFWVNHYGSEALIAATPSLEFEKLAGRLAPWRLLEAARVRGADPKEVRLAAEMFGNVLGTSSLNELDPGSDLWVDLRRFAEYPSFYGINLRQHSRPESDSVTVLKQDEALEVRRLAWRRAVDAAEQRIAAARASGAALYLAEVGTTDVVLVVRHAPEFIEAWLTGMDEVSEDFRRRVRLAERAYLTICEVLLESDPDRGVSLWMALRSTLTVRYLGAGGVDELLHIAFRATCSSAVGELRASLVDLSRCNTDRHLSEIALAAAFNREQDWLDRQIAGDKASAHNWQQRRGLVLSGLTSNNTLPVDGAWPIGEIESDNAELTRRSARQRSGEAIAHHWWNAFISAQTSEEAYAAWILFLRTTDCRCAVWMDSNVPDLNSADPLTRAKAVHMRINRSSVENRSNDRSKKFQGKFLNIDTLNGIGPWGKEFPVGLN